MNKETSSDRYNIKGAERCFQILDLAIKLDRSISIADVMQTFGVNTNMAFRLLSTVVSSGYMEKNEQTGQYSISLKSLQLSKNALLSLEIRRLTMPYLELVWTQYKKANLNLAVMYDKDIVVVDRIDSLTLPRTYFTPGKTLPFHASGLGKILVSEIPDDQLEQLITAKGLKSYTENTITTTEALHAELAKVRKEQVARDRQEFVVDDNCNAVPIRDKTGKIVAAISLSALQSNMSVEEVESTIPMLQETSKKISYMLGYNGALA
ncbi:MAG: IclR family transcriptional regulator [Sphaerochaeta sp.]|jgi:DNA-binding IclR family transcriptional regulator|nr:IclR family transcriptional regulator [Sphaerochaeta sp.]MCH3919808.1 IclR family transcriptional regulator [Sphaerochaeta sp.]MCI2076430.1 IclR family transcriptional regulator [Sphaerochaeta sp.]MCI2103962.1 IclR family transcriptional regulator [Sphaerochaeta sp.]